MSKAVVSNACTACSVGKTIVKDDDASDSVSYGAFNSTADRKWAVTSAACSATASVLGKIEWGS